MSKARPARPYSPEEDRVILSNWWDPKRRKAVCERLGRPAQGASFRYYSLLRKMGKSPQEHRLEMMVRERGLRDLLRSSAPMPGEVPQGAVPATSEAIVDGLAALRSAHEAALRELENYRRLLGKWLAALGQACQRGVPDPDGIQLLDEVNRIRKRQRELGRGLREKEARLAHTLARTRRTVPAPGRMANAGAELPAVAPRERRPKPGAQA